MARRAGVALDLDRFDALARKTPVLANVRPSGKYLMEDFYYAGGLRALLARARRPPRRLGADGERPHARRERRGREDLQRRRDPRARESAGGARRPRGAARQPRARRRGDQARRRWRRGCRSTPAARSCSGTTTTWPRASTIRRSTSTRTACSCCRTPGRSGAPGMPEWGQLPIPKKLLQAGRARHGAHLRCAHERHELRRVRAARGARVVRRRPARARARRRPDRARRSRRARSTLQVDDAELARRRAAWKAPEPHYARGFGALYLEHVTQANEGCDFDFLESGAPTPDPEIH